MWLHLAMNDIMGKLEPTFTVTERNGCMLSLGSSIDQRQLGQSDCLKLFKSKSNSTTNSFALFLLLKTYSSNVFFSLLVSLSLGYSLQRHLGVGPRWLLLHQDPFWVREGDAAESGLQPGGHLQGGGHPLRRQTGQLAGHPRWQGQAAAGERNHSQQEQVELEASQWPGWARKANKGLFIRGLKTNIEHLLTSPLRGTERTDTSERQPPSYKLAHLTDLPLLWSRDRDQMFPWSLEVEGPQRIKWSNNHFPGIIFRKGQISKRSRAEHNWIELKPFRATCDVILSVAYKVFVLASEL